MRTRLAMYQVFHTVERERQGGCETRQESLLRGLLLGEERSWELFAREQGRLFENALEKVKSLSLNILWLRKDFDTELSDTISKATGKS